MNKRKKSFKDLATLVLIALAFIVLGRGLFQGPGSGWKTDFDNASIDMDEVISGGVPRDGIPPIDDPTFVEAALAVELSPQSPVIALEIEGDARAYPLEVLTRHEIVNDVVSGAPIAVTFCPLCNSAVVFDRRVADKVLRFGVSGNLRYSDLIMWDDLTETWWQQLTGEAIVGRYRDYVLRMISSQLVSFEVFRQRYPAGKVLRGPLGGYGRNPYIGYDSNPKPFLFKGPLDDRLFATERVLGAVIGGQAVSYAFSALKESPVVNDRVSDRDIVIFWQSGAVSALDAGDIDSSKDVGMALMYDRRLPSGQMLSFRHDAGRFIDRETESNWNIWGEATDGPLAGSSLSQLNAYPHFWFAWAAFYPETILYSIE